MAEQLFADVEQWAEAVAKKTVDKVRDKVVEDLTKKAYECIDRFYADPVFYHETYKGSGKYFQSNEPRIYNRTHNLYNAIQRYSNTHRGRYEFGIVFDSTKMHDNYRGAREYVMWNTLILGYHGLEYDHAPQTLPSVFDEVQEYNDTVLAAKIPAIMDQAISEAIEEIGVI